ncbi:MAG: hypothetical protein KAI66_17775, partial [Lentisphaeria bacterium]|nr:hypothetical protein [Lentisphaeria bacterium]
MRKIDLALILALSFGVLVGSGLPAYGKANNPADTDKPCDEARGCDDCGKFVEDPCNNESTQTSPDNSSDHRSCSDCAIGKCTPCVSSMRFEISLGGALRPGAIKPGDLWVDAENWSVDLGMPLSLKSEWDSEIQYTGQSGPKFLSRRGGEVQGSALSSGISTPDASSADYGIYLKALDSNGNPTSSSPATFQTHYANGIHNTYMQDPNDNTRWMMASRTYAGGREV